jgi:hypothetical protein
MDEVYKLIDSQYYTSSSEPFRIYRIVRSAIFWDVAPIVPFENWRFGWTCFHLQGKNTRRARSNASVISLLIQHQRPFCLADSLYPEALLRNVGCHKIHTAPLPRIQYPSYSLPWNLKFSIQECFEQRLRDVRFEAFTAVTMKNGVFWDVTPCDSCMNRRYEGT